MDIPNENSREANKARRIIIKAFYADWISKHPEKKIWNQSLKAYINVKNDSVNEALGHAPRPCPKVIRCYCGSDAFVRK